VATSQIIGANCRPFVIDVSYARPPLTSWQYDIVLFERRQAKLELFESYTCYVPADRPATAGGTAGYCRGGCQMMQRAALQGTGHTTPSPSLPAVMVHRTQATAAVRRAAQFSCVAARPGHDHEVLASALVLVVVESTPGSDSGGHQ